MFEALGRAVVRGKWFIIVAWLAIAGGMFFFAPSLAKVGTASDAAFLPSDAPSLIAEDVLNKDFPELATGGQGLIVVHDPGGLSAADRQYAGALVDWLRSGEAPQQVGRVTSVFNQPELEGLLTSKDNTTMLIRLDFTSPTYSDATNTALALVRDHIRVTRPQGLVVDFTGQAAITKDLLGNIMDSVSQTTLVTVILVILVLLFIYRSPIAAGIPLVTIGVAFLITRGILGILVQSGIMRVSSMVEAFIVVLIFGAGTDYALFLISRYREEVANRPDHDRESADIQTVARIGPVITASAATVIISTFGMIVARFEMTRTQGPAMALGIAIGLVASLTLTPALLSVLGKYLFWPFHEQIRAAEGTERKSGFWQRLAAFVTSRPGLVAAGITALLLLPYLALPQLTRSFDVLSELPKDTESRRGFDVMRQHFDQGEMMPVSVVLTGTAGLQSPAGLASIARVEASLAAVPGVARVRSVVSPSGGENPEIDRNLLAGEQVLTLTRQLKQNLRKLDASSMATSSASPTAQLDELDKYLDDLGAAFPATAQTAAFRGSRTALGSLRTEIDKSLQGLQVSTQVSALADQVGQVNSASSGGAQGQDPAQGLAAARSYMGELAQAFPEVENDPSYTKALAGLDQLGNALAAARQQAQVSAQLGLLAGQVEQFRQAAGSTATQASPAGQASPASQIAVIGGYLQELGQAYPEAAALPEYGDALSAVQRLQTALTQLDQARAAGGAPSPAQLRQLQQVNAGLQADAQKLQVDLQTMSKAFAGRDAPFASKVLALTPQAQQQKAALGQLASDVRSSLTTLAARFQGRDARLLPTSLPASPERDKAQASLRQAADNLTASLDSLAAAMPKDAYFLPQSLLKEQPELGKLVDTFLSANRKSTQLQVLLGVDPYSEAALKTADNIESTASQEADALAMAAYTSGPTVQVRDIHQMVNDDLPRVMTLVVGGVFLVFVLLLGSLVAPIYLVATVLLSYGTTMGLITILFQWVLGENGINYVIPTIILVLLVALGADYNIFLISRVWEEASKGGSVRDGVRRASAFTGGVITSAGIILAGTFAALMVAPIQTLFQVGVAVSLGVLVDTFIVRAVLVPALAAIVGRFNWWPASRPAGQGGAFRAIADRLRPRAAQGPGSAHR